MSRVQMHQIPTSSSCSGSCAGGWTTLQSPQIYTRRSCAVFQLRHGLDPSCTPPLLTPVELKNMSAVFCPPDHVYLLTFYWLGLPPLLFLLVPWISRLVKEFLFCLSLRSRVCTGSFTLKINRILPLFSVSDFLPVQSAMCSLTRLQYYSERSPGLCVACLRIAWATAQGLAAAYVMNDIWYG